MSPKALSLLTLVCQKANGSGHWETGHSGLMGADWGDDTSITHYQILPSIPTRLLCAEANAQDLWADDTQLCRCNVTTLIYITALSNSFSAQPKRWTCIAKGGNGFVAVTWDNTSPSTALTTGTLLTEELTAPLPRYSLMGCAILLLFQTLLPPTQAYTPSKCRQDF